MKKLHHPKQTIHNSVQTQSDNLTDNISCRVPFLLRDAVYSLYVEQRGLLRVEVVAETPDPPEVRHPVEGHGAQGQQLASVVITPGQPEPVTGQVKVTDILKRKTPR